MKFKKAFYCNNGPINPKYTRDDWLRNKDIYFRGSTSADFQRDFGIEIKPRRRHRRSIRIRDIRLRFDLKSRLYEYASKNKRNFRRMWIREY